MTVTVQDDDGMAVSDTFTVEVLNVLPTLDAGMNQTVNESVTGMPTVLTTVFLDPSTFTDPGFDHDVLDDSLDTFENFTATIDWGDGTTEPGEDITLVEVAGSEGVLTTGTIQATHAYACPSIEYFANYLIF